MSFELGSTVQMNNFSVENSKPFCLFSILEWRRWWFWLTGRVINLTKANKHWGPSEPWWALLGFRGHRGLSVQATKHSECCSYPCGFLLLLQYGVSKGYWRKWQECIFVARTHAAKILTLLHVCGYCDQFLTVKTVVRITIITVIVWLIWSIHIS